MEDQQQQQWTPAEFAAFNAIEVADLTPDEIAACRPPTLREKAQDAAEEVMARSRSGVERIWTQAELCNEFVYVRTLKQFVHRTDPELVFDITGFDNGFAYAKGNATKLSKALFERVRGTVRRVDGIAYLPNAPEFTTDNKWNGWRKSEVEPVEGDTTLFRKHVEYLFPDNADQNHLLNWLAAVLQHPETKPRHQLVLRGAVQGTGKTFFARLMRELLGASNCQMLTQDILVNNFTGWAYRTKLVWIEEVRDLNSNSATAKLHSWASEGTITINQKNLPTWSMEQTLAFIIMSNKDDPLKLDDTDRRYLMLKTDAEIHPDGGAYYDRLYGVNNVGGVLNDPAALGAILHELLHRDLGGYSIEQRAPFTAAKAETIEAGASEVAQYLHDNDCIGGRRVVRAENIVVELPPRLQVRGATKAVREFLKSHHGKQWPDQIRVDGDKIRVWIIGDPKSKSDGKLTGSIVARMYREDSDKAKAEFAADDPAA